MNFNVFESPGLREAAEFIKSAINSKNVILIIGECRVDYEGRASSRLELGERIVLIKQDGAVLVHRPVNYSPVNWQPSSSMIEVIYKDGVGLVIHAVRDRPREYLTVVFTKIHVLFTGRLIDSGNFTMYMDEDEIRNVLANNPFLIEEELSILAIEKQIGDGYIDIYAIDKNGRHVLVEIKRITATREAVLQLYRYVEAYKSQYGETPRGILVAPALSPSALESALNLGLEYKNIDLRKLWGYIKKRQSKRTTLIEFTKGCGDEFSR